MKNPDYPLSNIRIVLDHTHHPGNIGSAARAMKTMGLRHLYLVAPARFPDEEANALACDARDVLEQAVVRASLDEALGDCAIAVGLTARRRDLQHPCLDVRVAARRVLEAAQTQPVALLFGNETAGLSNDELSRCQYVVNIPTDDAYRSLNVASAVQIMAYELFMASQDFTPGEIAQPELALLEEIEFFYQQLEKTLINIRFLDPEHPKRLMPRIRRLFARTQLEKEEFNILMGFLKQINLHVKSKMD